MRGFPMHEGLEHKEKESDEQGNPSNIDSVSNGKVVINGESFSDQGLDTEFMQLKKAGKSAPTNEDGSPNYPEVDAMATAGPPEKAKTGPRTPGPIE